MGFSEAVQWWEKWQLRILVLTSLFLQFFLFFASILRKRCIPSWLRFLIWLAYLSSDAVAIYALATLFNRPKKQEGMSTDQSSATLQVLWAPILLIHLGGQDSITAYNIEDNELWRRHVLTAVYQVVVAIYVFWKSCPHDRRILGAGVVLLVVGVLKCVCKPWDLKRVSINSLVGSSAGSEQNPENVSSPDEYVRAATEYFREAQPTGTGHHDAEMEIQPPYDLFIDLAPPYSDRLSCLKATVHNNPEKAHALVRDGLSQTFDRLYTKESLLFHNIRNKRFARWISVARFGIIGGCVGGTVSFLFPYNIRNNRLHRIDFGHNEAFDFTDVAITSILLSLFVAQDYLFPGAMRCIPIISRNFKGRRPDKVVQIIQRFFKGPWPDEVAQYNLMGYLVRNKKHRKRRRLATLLLCKDYIDQLWCMKASKSSRDITRLVHSYIAKGWTEHHIKDMATYSAFNDNRGQWTLKQEGCSGCLEWSLRPQLDESVLLWHLATDFCFHGRDLHPSNEETARHCRVMSNYMVYLLFVNPEMLMTGARRSLFRAAYRKLKDLLKESPTLDVDGRPDDEKQLVERIIQQVRSDVLTQDSSVIHDAWTLAKELMDLGSNHGEDKMWRVIQDVWVEILCFSAGRCRGYLHAKNLGKGGEYLSYVWLLLFYMGMETLAEKMQRLAQQDEATSNRGGANTTTAASTSAAIPVPAAGGGHGDDTTEASVPVTEGGMIPASPVATTDGGGDGRTATSPVTLTPSGNDEIV